MGDYRLKIKIGEHEFEAEGPVEAVQVQFTEFKQLIATVPPAPSKKTTEAKTNEIGTSNEVESVPLGKIVRVDRRIVSLTARAGSLGDSILVILLGQKEFRNNEASTGSEIIDGLKHSGQVVSRIDATMETLASEGDVIKTGTHRGTRYRLTNQGLARARGIAKEIASLVP